MRQRIEDLGRLSVLIRNIIYEDYDFTNQNSLWECLGRPKYAEATFEALTEEQKGDFIHSLAYSLESLGWKLHELLSIAEGTDSLNEVEAD